MKIKGGSGIPQWTSHIITLKLQIEEIASLMCRVPRLNYLTADQYQSSASGTTWNATPPLQWWFVCQVQKRMQWPLGSRLWRSRQRWAQKCGLHWELNYFEDFLTSASSLTDPAAREDLWICNEASVSGKWSPKVSIYREPNVPEWSHLVSCHHPLLN